MPKIDLTLLGVNLTVIEPGAWSSQRHWHTHEDELVWVVEGELSLVTDAGEAILRAGASAMPRCPAFAAPAARTLTLTVSFQASGSSASSSKRATSAVTAFNHGVHALYSAVRRSPFRKVMAGRGALRGGFLSGHGWVLYKSLARGFVRRIRCISDNVAGWDCVCPKYALYFGQR